MLLYTEPSRDNLQAMNASCNYSQIRAVEPFERALVKKFYAKNNYSASRLGQDKIYVIEHQPLIYQAVVIISRIDDRYFLHGLVVDHTCRKQGLGQHLVRYLCKVYTQLICFADIGLAPFYEHNGFVQISESALLSHSSLRRRYQSYRTKQPTLIIFESH